MWFPVQLALIGFVAFPGLYIGGMQAFEAIWFGGSMAILNVYLLQRCQKRELRVVRSADKTLAAMYLCVLQRFIIIALLFYASLGMLELVPLAVLVGFIMGQSILFLPGLIRVK
ncbi:MAG: ATP synthase subunit I [Gammaproteobacteria bacterium]